MALSQGKEPVDLVTDRADTWPQNADDRRAGHRSATRVLDAAPAAPVVKIPHGTPRRPSLVIECDP